MDMTVVLGIFTLFFFTSLFIMCFYRSKINVKFWNRVFIIADFVAYSCWNFASYEVGWLNRGWMTLGNISPLMFTLILFIPFVKDTFKDGIYSMLACLNLGMFVAMLVSPEHDYIFNFNTRATFVYTSEAVCHMLCSLFGIYLVLSKQVKANFKQWLKGTSYLLSIITFGVILNFIFRRNHFGMDPYGGASIYMIDIFEGFWPTLIAYYFGVILVMTLGVQTVAFLDKATERFAEADPVSAEFSTESAVSDAEAEPVPDCASVEIDPDEAEDLEEIMLSVNLAEGIPAATDAEENNDLYVMDNNNNGEK